MVEQTPPTEPLRSYEHGVSSQDAKFIERIDLFPPAFDSDGTVPAYLMVTHIHNDRLEDNLLLISDGEFAFFYHSLAAAESESRTERVIAKLNLRSALNKKSAIVRMRRGATLARTSRSI